MSGPTAAMSSGGWPASERAGRWQAQAAIQSCRLRPGDGEQPTNRTPKILGPEPRRTSAMPISAGLARWRPAHRVQSCCHGAAIQPKGPTTISGDQASDLHFPGSGGRI